MRTVWRAVAFALLIAGAPPMAGATNEPALGRDVDGLLAYARSRNPDWLAMRSEAEAAAERIGPAGALPDPVFRTELENISNYPRDAATNLLPTRVGSAKYTLMQMLPWWGKRDLKRDVAAAAADESRARAAGSWVDVAARIKIAYAQYFQLSRNLQFGREVLDLIERLTGIAQVRYAGGLAPQQDSIRAQVERTAVQSELIAMETERHHAMIRLNAALARAADAPLQAPEALRPVPPRFDVAALTSKLREKNPELFAEDARIRGAQSNRDLTYRNRYPDVTLGVSPKQTGTRVYEWGVMLELNIPLQQESRRGQEREAEKAIETAQARKFAAANRLEAELSESVAILEGARRVETLTATSLLPQAELTLQAALVGYENGKVDFASALDAQKQIRKARQDLVKAQAEQRMRLADIERLIGEEM